jgi:ABC-type polysaccharide transport system permease subunit
MTSTTDRPPTQTMLARLIELASRRSDGTAWGTIMVFLTPALLIYLAFTAYPVVRTFYNAVHIIRPRGNDEYVGLTNFYTLYTNDALFVKAVTNTLIWALSWRWPCIPGCRSHGSFALPGSHPC